MAMEDSLRLFFLVLLAIIAIATRPEIYVAGQVIGGGHVATTVSDNNVNRVGVAAGGGVGSHFLPSLLSSSNSTRPDDYEDYFEATDDSIQAFGDLAFPTPESAYSEKLSSWSPPSPPPSPVDNDDFLEPIPGQASLVIIFDASATMQEELQGFRKEARNIIQELNAWDRIPVFNYILVPVTDSGESPNGFRIGVLWDLKWDFLFSFSCGSKNCHKKRGKVLGGR